MTFSCYRVFRFVVKISIQIRRISIIPVGYTGHGKFERKTDKDVVVERYEGTCADGKRHGKGIQEEWTNDGMFLLKKYEVILPNHIEPRLLFIYRCLTFYHFCL